MPKIACEKCGEEYKYSKADAGQSVTCDCGGIIAIPNPAPPQAAATVEKLPCARCFRAFPRDDLTQKHGANYCPKCEAKRQNEETAYLRSRETAPTVAAAVPAPGLAAAPDYFGMAFAGVIARATGVAALLAGVVLIFTAMDQSSARMAEEGLAAAVGGVMSLAAGEALGALRDIARNSFRN